MSRSMSVPEVALFAEESPVREAIASLQGFPSLYPVVQRALKQLDDPNITSSGLQQTLIADPASIARLLTLANSAYFSARRQIKTVSAAITLIGFDRLRSLLRCVLVAGLFEMLSTRRPAAMKIRARALATAGICHQIARRFDNVDPEEWLVAGLLHNIGELALSWVSPEMYASSLKLSGSLPRREAQDLIFGVDSHRVGGWVLDNWCFPPQMSLAAEYWDGGMPSTCDERMRRLLLAVQLSAALAAGYEANLPFEHAVLQADADKDLGLGETELRELYAGIPIHMKAMQTVIQG